MRFKEIWVFVWGKKKYAIKVVQQKWYSSFFVMDWWIYNFPCNSRYKWIAFTPFIPSTQKNRVLAWNFSPNLKEKDAWCTPDGAHRDSQSQMSQWRHQTQFNYICASLNCVFTYVPLILSLPFYVCSTHE